MKKATAISETICSEDLYKTKGKILFLVGKFNSKHPQTLKIKKYWEKESKNGLMDEIIWDLSKAIVFVELWQNYWKGEIQHWKEVLKK